MHKYQPIVHVLMRNRALPLLENGGRISCGAFLPKDINNKISTFKFQETQFMAVTAYQNQLVNRFFNKIGLIIGFLGYGFKN